MTRVRIGTFNVENLFARFKFRKNFPPEELMEVIKEGWCTDRTKFDVYKPEDRYITAQAIRAIDADILALQEVENLDVLKRFNSQYLRGLDYRYALVIDGNDPRRIDVALLSRYPLATIRTHQFERTRSRRSYVFSRDCLEVDIQVAERTRLPVFINHFKSMVGGRAKTMARRRVQAEAVVRILEGRFGPEPGEEAFVVLGDLNDYLPSRGLEPLAGRGWLENVVETRIPNPDERWTHYYKGQNEYRQLDYILLSRALAEANLDAVPYIERRGLLKRAKRAKEGRFEGVGKNKPKASDHCPVVIEIRL